LDLKNEVAIVTGGSKGLGWSIAYELAKAGSNIAIIYSPNGNYPEDKVLKLRDMGGTAEAYKANVTNPVEIQKVFENVSEYFGKIDILVNNAGIMRETLLSKMTEEEWDLTIETNLKSVFLCCKNILPYFFSQKKGSIINVSSQLAYKGGKELTHYSASKAGIIAFTKSLAQEVAQEGIRVNAIAPGPLQTDMTKPFMDNTNWVQNKKESVALGRLGTTDEVAPTVVFLASSDASIYVGQTLLPNGGGVML